MADYTYTVGPSGRTYTTIQAAWNALPSTIATGDRYFITLAAALYTAGLKCSTSAKTISGTGQVIVLPETGAAWYEQSGALARYDNTKGATIEASPFLEASFILQDKVSVQGLQMNGGTTKGAIDYSGTVTSASISRCLIQADSTDNYCLNISPAITGDIYNNIFITSSTTVQPINFSDTNGTTVNFVGNTVICTGTGTQAWNKGQYGTGLRVKDCAVFGFASTDTTRINTANSNNNATDLSTFPGSSNATSLTASAQFVDTAASTLDVRPKSGNSLVAGITNSLIAADVYGTTRAGTPTIGAAEYVTGGTTVSCMVGDAVAAGVTASILAALTITGITGNAIANGSLATITNAGSTTITGIVGNAVAAGSSAAVANLIKTSAMINNTESGPLASVAVVWTWWPAGRPGSMTGVTVTEGSGTLDSNGKLLTSVTAAPGVMMVAKLGADSTLDEVSYQAYV